MSNYARPIHRTATQDSGIIVNRPTTVSAFSVNSIDADCIVNLRNNGANGSIMWTLEADNAASSTTITFDPPIKFDNNVYLEFVVKGAQSSADVAVIE